MRSKRKVAVRGGWQRQAQLGDGGFTVRMTIAKAFGLDAATRLMPSISTLGTLPFLGAHRNRTRSCIVAVLVISAYVSLVRGQAPPAGQRTDPALWVRDGFSPSLALADVDRARFLAFALDGTLFVSQPDSGRIQACRDEDDDGYYEKSVVFVKDHPTVQGMFWHEGWLWFTESGAIFRGRDTNTDRRKIWTHDLRR